MRDRLVTLCSRRRIERACIRAVGAAALVACGSGARLPLSAGTGANPELPAPATSLIPTVNVATATGWPPGAKPIAASGTVVAVFASKLDHPRWLYVLPNGDVLVAETRAVFVEGLYSPFGMALVGNDFYVANSDAVVRFPYVEGETHIGAPPIKVVDLPAGRRNHHWTKNLVANADGSKLYVSVGSNSNAAEHGIDAERDRAAIWEVDPKSGQHRIFASGLRNPVGMAWNAETGALWVSVNERDELGSDLVPDFMTSVRDGGFYGFPYSYYGQHVDARVKPQRPDLVATAIVPDYALGPHTASLGLASSRGTTLPARFRDGMFVGQHGSWNRKPPSGYRVIFVPFSGGRPSGDPIDVLTGFLNANGEAQGRPVGVAIDKRGALLVADDVGNTVWRVTATP